MNFKPWKWSRWEGSKIRHLLKHRGETGKRGLTYCSLSWTQPTCFYCMWSYKVIWTCGSPFSCSWKCIGQSQVFLKIWNELPLIKHFFHYITQQQAPSSYCLCKNGDTDLFLASSGNCMVHAGGLTPGMYNGNEVQWGNRRGWFNVMGSQKTLSWKLRKEKTIRQGNWKNLGSASRVPDAVCSPFAVGQVGHKASV